MHRHQRGFRSLSCCLLVMIALAVLPGAKYPMTPIYDLFGVSDLIVIGSISRLGTETLTLEVEEVLRGSTEFDSLKIKKLLHWSTFGRWQPYAVGQRVVAFLVRDDDRYRLRSVGAEGELPLIGNDVFVYSYSVPGVVSEEVNGVLGYRLSLDDLRSAVREFGDCFELEIIEGRWTRVEGIEQICDDTLLDRYRSRSALHAFVARVTTMTAARLKERDSQACRMSVDPSVATLAVALIHQRGQIVLNDWYHPIEVTELTVEPDGPYEMLKLNSSRHLDLAYTYLPAEDGSLENLGWLLDCGRADVPRSIPEPFSPLAEATSELLPRQVPQVLGLAEIPGLFGDYRGLPSEPDELQLFAEPSSDSATVRWIARADELASDLFQGETRAAVVRERQDDWLRLSTTAGEDGWVSIDSAVAFRSLQWLSKFRQMILKQSWDGLLYSSPDLTAAQRQMSPVWRKHMVSSDSEVEIDVKAVRWVGNILWFDVEIMSGSVCGGSGQPKVMARGWLPAHNVEGEAAVWFHPKSC